MKSILLLGSHENKSDPLKTGGVVVLYKLLREELKSKNISFQSIDTLRDNYSNTPSALFSVWFQLIRYFSRHTHISLHGMFSSIVYVGPVIILLGKIFKKEISVRVFAGDLIETYEGSSKIKRKLIEYVLKNTNANFFETKYLVEYFKKFNPHTYWMPNVRNRTLKPSMPRPFRKKFIFIGTINEEKGIDEICTIIPDLDKDITFDIYGPIIEEKYSQEYFSNRGVSYKGAVNPEGVLDLLNQYDVLVLPSYKEGYPGVVIEAMSLGMPVIATKLDGISEMIDDKFDGLLIEAGESQQLLKTILSIDQTSYSLLSQNAFDNFDNFDSKIQTNLLLERIGFDT